MFNPNDMALIKSSFILMVAGMGMTFIFLVILVWCTNISSKITSKFAHLVPEPEPKKAAPKQQAPAADEGAVIAAMAAAVHHANKG